MTGEPSLTKLNLVPNLILGLRLIFKPDFLVYKGVVCSKDVPHIALRALAIHHSLLPRNGVDRPRRSPAWVVRVRFVIISSGSNLCQLRSGESQSHLDNRSRGRLSFSRHHLLTALVAGESDQPCPAFLSAAPREGRQRHLHRLGLLIVLETTPPGLSRILLLATRGARELDSVACRCGRFQMPWRLSIESGIGRSPSGGVLVGSVAQAVSSLHRRWFVGLLSTGAREHILVCKGFAWMPALAPVLQGRRCMANSKLYKEFLNRSDRLFASLRCACQASSRTRLASVARSRRSASPSPPPKELGCQSSLLQQMSRLQLWRKPCPSCRPE